MTSIGHLFLLTVLVCSGYAAYLYLAYGDRQHRLVRRAAIAGGVVAFLALSCAVVILAWALLARDFRFDYVVRYSSQQLPWHYSLSALWVGQAGSLLLWAWMLGVATLVFRLLPTTDVVVQDTATGVLLANVAFLASIMIFAADPFKPTLGVPREGLGLSPLLQHPSMLFHPPVVFLAYSTWTVPFALAASALLRGRLDTGWVEMARPWAVTAWGVLGVGLLLGAHWAYQELGWGGYWGWDPVENGSLLPWLTGTAFIHCLMAWRHRNCLKKTAVLLAFLTYGLCNFATFLTRSGIFSSVHAFSESPIGWMFLALMAVLLVGGLALVFLRRESMVPERVARSLLARETLIVVSTFLFLMLGLVVMASTLVAPLSMFFTGRTVLVGPSIYNNVLTSVGLLLMAVTAAVPLLRWGGAPGTVQRRVLWACLGISVAATGISFFLGARHFISLTVTGLATLAGCATLATVVIDTQRRDLRGFVPGLLRMLRDGRRRYAGYAAHLSFVALAVGITGSSLGSHRHEVVMKEGEVTVWAGWQIRYVEMGQQTFPDKLVAEAVLEVAKEGHPWVMLRPARHFHCLQDEWTTEVAIHSTWGGDFYTILNAGLGDGSVALTFVENPMMRWLWLGGIGVTLSALVAVWPAARRSNTGSLADGGPNPAGQIVDKTNARTRAA